MAHDQPKDGSTASRAVPAPHDPSLLEILGIVPWDTSDEYHEIIQEYIVNGHKNRNSYEIMVAKLAGLGKYTPGSMPVRRLRPAPQPLVALNAALDATS